MGAGDGSWREGGSDTWPTGWPSSSGCTCGPSARSRGIAGELLVALESAAYALGYRWARLDTGPRQVHAIRLYEGAGFVPIEPYNDNPYASFWGEKELTPPVA